MEKQEGAPAVPNPEQGTEDFYDIGRAGYEANQTGEGGINEELALAQIKLKRLQGYKSEHNSTDPDLDKAIQEAQDKFNELLEDEKKRNPDEPLVSSEQMADVNERANEARRAEAPEKVEEKIEALKRKIENADGIPQDVLEMTGGDIDAAKNVMKVRESYGSNKWWESSDPKVKALGQLNEKTLIISQEDFIDSVSQVLGREIGVQELPQARRLIEDADYKKQKEKLTSEQGILELMNSSRTYEEWDKNKKEVMRFNVGADGKERVPDFWDESAMDRIKENLLAQGNRKKYEEESAIEKATLEAKNAAFRAREAVRKEAEKNNPPKPKSLLRRILGR